PLFVNCTIENNSAQGGNGGNGGGESDGGGLANYGGNYSPAMLLNIDPNGLGYRVVTEQLWSLWEWDYATQMAAVFGSYGVSLELDPNLVAVGGGPYVGEPRWYSAYGGGVFVDSNSTARFVSCTIRNNQTSGGLTGQGGSQTNGTYTEPLNAFELPSYGGGVYCAAGTTVTFKECVFQNNAASVPTATVSYRLDPYIGYGGGVAAEETSCVQFIDCNFVDNVADTGGALYAADGTVVVTDTLVISNTALRGAGIAGAGGQITISGCEVKANTATLDVNDTSDDVVVPFGGGILCSTVNAMIRDCNIVGNTSDGSGGGIYARGEGDTDIINCLIRDNLAYRDGGGVSTNWYTTTTVRNCTFVNNVSSGVTGNRDNSGFGGGLFCGYHSECVVVDSILWENYARLGTQLAVGTGFDLDRQCGELSVSYSDIMSEANDVYVDKGCTLTYGNGIIHKNPQFVTNALGGFWLSNPAAGQEVLSPCVDAGSGLAGALGMSAYTTRTDRVPDSGRVDMGFHHIVYEPCKFCDLVKDGVIQFRDFAAFANKWLCSGCSETTGWCDGADFTFDSKVDAFDLAFLADCWLAQDTSAPMPDPAQWEIAPYKDSSSVVSMRAVEAIDAWGWDVEYYFDCVYGQGHDSGWQTSRTYADGGLTKGAEYGYRVKARDALGNETDWSPVMYAGSLDQTSPSPSPYIVTAVADSSTQVTLTSQVAYDESGVQYYFDTNTPGAHASGWLDDPNYTDVNLVPTTRYAYRVKARDLSGRYNETPWSDWVYVTTQTPTETVAPTPDPMTFDPNGMPAEVSGGGGSMDFYAEMTATTATDASGGVQYFFECDDHSGFNSDWQDEADYRVYIGRYNQSLRFRVKARDTYGNETAWSEWAQMTLSNTY
ncbi:MAG: right-handed parallel beta-helix repeat-containing protein, partial [Solirubrobacterales bacterium]